MSQQSCVRLMPDIATMTPRGRVGMAWQRTAQTTTYRITIPAGATALVTLPVIRFQDGKGTKIWPR